MTDCVVDGPDRAPSGSPDRVAIIDTNVVVADLVLVTGDKLPLSDAGMRGRVIGANDWVARG